MTPNSKLSVLGRTREFNIRHYVHVTACISGLPVEPHRPCTTAVHGLAVVECRPASKKSATDAAADDTDVEITVEFVDEDEENELYIDADNDESEEGMGAGRGEQIQGVPRSWKVLEF